MKHELKVTFLLIGMFVLTQFIGLYVINSNPFSISQEINGTIQQVSNPVLSWMNAPETNNETNFGSYFGSMIVSFIFSIILLLLLIKFKINIVLKIWFFVVVTFALFLSFTAIFSESTFFFIPLVIALILASLKIFQRHFIIHNFTELLIYPGIACVFIPILNFWSAICLLVLISIYDMWAVWHSGIMQKMAKYQMNNLKIFSGFFIPYFSKKVKEQIKQFKKMDKSKMKNKKIKANIAILGGGDVVFPIITSGVIFTTKQVNLPFDLTPFIGGFIPALFIIIGATLGLSLLLAFSQKKKFYPAMPFISAGIFFGIILSYLLVH
jgi:presenilin-like A22 family membrane protease